MKSIVRCLAFGASVLAAGTLVAQEEANENAGGDAAEDEVAALVAKPKQIEEKHFHTLPFCHRLEGRAEVRKCGSSEWVPVEEGKFYPLGSAYRTVAAGDRLAMQFGKNCEVEIEGVGSFSTRAQALDVKGRTIVLGSGKVNFKLPRNMPAGLFTVTSPGFSVEDVAGEGAVTFTGTGDGDEAIVRCVTGSMAVKGRHFTIPSMRAANEIRIRTSQDMLFTGLYGTSGDYIVKLDQGLIETRDFETGESRIDPKVLDWKMSPKMAVRIHRAVPAIGKRLSVTVMTFGTTGELVNRCAFAEGRHEVNSGELGKSLDDEKKKEAAKKAVEAAEADSPKADAAETEASDDGAEAAPSEKSEKSDDGEIDF